jgi:membrane fusion protein (multidrug efflux system)
MAAAAAPSQNTSSQPTTPAPRRERRLRGKGLKWIVALPVLAIGAFFAVRWWMEQSRFVSTDDAYVGANQAEIAAQVSGSVTQVFVRVQQHVK